MRKNSGQQHIKHPNPFASTQNKPPTAGFVELVDEKMKKKPSNKLTAWKATKMAAKLKKNPEEAQAKITEKALQAFALAQYLERHMRLQSAMLTIFAFLLVGLGNLVADLRVGIAATAYGACLALMEQEHTVCEAHLVNSSHLPHDFLQKGTISNVAQDISSVEGASGRWRSSSRRSGCSSRATRSSSTGRGSTPTPTRSGAPRPSCARCGRRSRRWASC